MKGTKILVATILGFIAGLVCWRLASSSGPMPASMVWSIILSRTLIGFVIGISAWKINYLAHGILIGLIISIPMAFASSSVPEKGTMIFWGTLILGAVYGFFIALITNLIVKEKKETPPVTA
jgi:hypothetical protein